jgi:hypothetical protein
VVLASGHVGGCEAGALPVPPGVRVEPVAAVLGLALAYPAGLGEAVGCDVDGRVDPVAAGVDGEVIALTTTGTAPTSAATANAEAATASPVRRRRTGGRRSRCDGGM